MALASPQRSAGGLVQGLYLEVETRGAALDDRLGDGVVAFGMAEQNGRAVQAGEGRVMGEVIQKMFDGAGLVHDVLPSKPSVGAVAGAASRICRGA